MALDLPYFSSAIAIALLVGLLFLIRTLFRMARSKNLPPGPAYLPLVGNLALLRSGGDFGKALDQIGYEYGAIASMWIGNRLIVMLNSGEAVTEAFVKQRALYEHRPVSTIDELWDPTGYSFITGNGARWREQRQTALRLMYQNGLDSNRLEASVHKEILEFFNGNEWRNGPFNMDPFIERFAFNVTANTQFQGHSGESQSKREQRRADFEMVRSRMAHVFSGFFIALACDVFPIMNYYPTYRRALNDMRKAVADIRAMVQRNVRQHRLEYDEDNICDVIDAYISECVQHNKEIDEPSIVSMISDLVLASNETIPTGLATILYFLCKYPQHQERIADEVVGVCGKTSLPTARSIPLLPYTRAFCYETLRCGNPFPITLTHMTSADSSVLGYTIPRHSMVIMNAYHVSRNEREFAEPLRMMPERFLNDKGQFDKGNSMLQFGRGGRGCPGEDISIKILVLVTGALVQRMRVEGEAGELLDFVADGGTLRPRRFDVTMRARDA